VIREFEYLPANYTIPSPSRQGVLEQPRRLLYAGIVHIDAALVG
jgi:hypothetical protein